MRVTELFARLPRPLARTKSTSAYDSLVKLIDTPSWRDSIRISGLIGLAGIADKRSLEIALKYSRVAIPLK